MARILLTIGGVEYSSELFRFKSFDCSISVVFPSFQAATNYSGIKGSTFANIDAAATTSDIENCDISAATYALS